MGKYQKFADDRDRQVAARSCRGQMLCREAANRPQSSDTRNVTHITRTVTATATLADAIINTSAGKALVIQSQNARREIADRIRNLKQMVHDTFVANVPRQHIRRWDVYQDSKEYCRVLGEHGGPEYDRTMTALKYTWTSKAAYDEAIAAVTFVGEYGEFGLTGKDPAPVVQAPTEPMESEDHLVEDYESSDGMARYAMIDVA